MVVSVIEPPEPIISWEEADKHLRLDGGADQKAYVESLIAVATGWLDGPTGWLGRAVLEARYEGWPQPLRLPCPPEIGIVSVKYVDQAGVEQNLPLDGSTVPYDGLPAVRGREGDVRIQYRAGYAAGKVPAPIRHAILLMVSHLFNNRDAVTTTAAQPAVLPMGVEALLAGFKAPRIG